MISKTKIMFIALCLSCVQSLWADEAQSANGSAHVSPKVQPDFIQCVDRSAVADGVLSIAVRHAPPFVYEAVNSLSGKRELEGIAVDYWEEVAQRLQLDYQYVCLNLSDTQTMLTYGLIDMAISPLTITKQREKIFDFSHQYFNSGLVFASGEAESNFDFEKAFGTLSNALSSNNVIYLAGIFLTLLVMLALLSMKNMASYQTMPTMKDKSTPIIIIHVMLYSILNITGIRKDVFGFSSVGMQLFSIIILIFGITVSASLFGMVTAALTQSVSPQVNFSIETMDQYHVSTLSGSTAEKFLLGSKKQPFSLELTDTWQDALQDVSEGKKDLVLGDWVQLVYLSQKPGLRDKITVHNQSFKFEPYGWGFKDNHPIKDSVNQELIGLLRSPLGADIVKYYIGEQQISMQIN
jgi:ABC-type amino acid transport substrate-binding protein